MDNINIPKDEEQKKIFSRNLNRYIVESGKLQNEVAKELNFAPTTFNTWCMGKVIPKMGRVQAIADYFGIMKSDLLEDKTANITEELDDFEKKLLSNFHALDVQGQSTVRYIMDNELKRCQKEQELYERVSELENKPKTVPTRIWAYYGKIAAAGTFVDFVDMIAGTKEYPVTDENKNADYTIGVSGDSMEPLYHDGDIVFVKQTTDLSIGDIGIFQKDNGIYIKEVGNGELISRNSAYGPIKNNGGIRCLGKVIAKAD